MANSNLVEAGPVGRRAWSEHTTTTRSRATWLLAKAQGRAGGEPAQGSSRSCRTKLVAGTTSTTPGAGNVGPSCSSPNSPCVACAWQGTSPPQPRWRITSRPTMVTTSCSISGSCSRCANAATAAARNSRKHTAINATSGLMAGRSIRTIQPTSHGLDLGAGRARGRCLPPVSSLVFVSTGRGASQKIRSPRAVDRPPRPKLLKCTIYD